MVSILKLPTGSIRRPVWLFVLAFLLLATAIAGPGDDSATVTRIRQAAERGDADAQFALGMAYFDGRGVKQDLVASSRWFAAAARQGVAEAQFNLGNAYHTGRGVARDPAQALRWWRAAADQGVANASHNLAVYYLEEPKNRAQAELGLAWLRRAAAGGWPDARRALRQLGEAWDLGSVGILDPAREPLRSEAGLYTLPPDHYTVQLLAAASLSGALDFVGDAHLAGRARIVRQVKGGRGLWLVLYGDYPNREQAQAAIAAMRSDLRAAEPWARRLGEVQRFVREVWRDQEDTRLSVSE